MLKIQGHLTIGKQLDQLLTHYSKVSTEQMANACDEHEYQDAEYLDGRINELLDIVADPDRRTVGFKLTEEQGIFVGTLAEEQKRILMEKITEMTEQIHLLDNINKTARETSKYGHYML